MKSKRKEIFEILNTKLVIEDKNFELKWGERLIDLTKYSENHLIDKDYVFLNFGLCKIFGNLEIKLSTTILTTSGNKFTEIGGALNNNMEAKELHKKFEEILGKADLYQESYDELYTSWENEKSKIIIYPRHHMGGEWFEYKIMTKNSH